MPVRPLLIFPTPIPVEREKPRGWGQPIHIPSHSNQVSRISPQFAQLQAQFDQRRALLQQTTLGIDPEMVLVIETRGDIEDFARAVNRISGLEWMGEQLLRNLEPDQDFYFDNNRDKKINGRLFLIMTNNVALQQLLSLWERFQNNRNVNWRPFTKFRDIFDHIKSIRYWNHEDRLSEYGIYQEWQHVLDTEPDRRVRFEIELWYRSSDEKRQASQQSVSRLINDTGGRVLNNCIISEICYHSLLAEVPAQAIQEILNHSETKLIDSDEVMFFKPIGQMAVGGRVIEADLPSIDHEVIATLPIPREDPIIALLDGLPLEHHTLLSNRLIIDDPNQLSEAYSPAEQVHGTGMASLIVHGDLNDGINPISRKVYVRPIMKPDPTMRPPLRLEVVSEDNELGIDLIHQAVRRIFEGDGTDPVAPTIRIINFSICYPNYHFTRTISPLARLFDWLSEKYNVLFIISAGNHLEPINTNLSRTTFDNLNPSQIEEEVVKSLFSDLRNRKILSPAESINSITVGALHRDNAALNLGDNRLDLFESVLPSTCSPFGSGYQRSVKPDLVYSGGRIIFHLPLPTENNITFRQNCQGNIGPGNLQATPGNIAGDLSRTIFECGTSNATALISRAASFCYDSLTDILYQQSPENYVPFITPLLKAMIIHSCSWGDMQERLEMILHNDTYEISLNSRITKWLGYGTPNFNNVTECREGRATLIGFGQLDADEAHIFHLPLPHSLGGRQEKRRLTITLAWLSPIEPSTQKYRAANLWFDLNFQPLNVKRKEVDRRTVKRGTVQHEIFEGDSTILPFSDDEHLDIQVNCKNDVGTFNGPIKYGLVVSLEVAEGLDIPIYDEIRTKIAPLIQIRTGAPQDT